MADISSITLPSGDTFYFKDSLARELASVSGVKGDAELSYRTGNINLTPANIGAASQSDLVSSISASSTDTQFPSAKCVYDSIGNKQTANLVTSLSSSSTDAQYPSAKCVYDTVSLKQSTNNLVTSISSSSTDTQYPSAKCMYDIIGNVESLLSSI